MTFSKPRILVADDETRIHDFFIEAFRKDDVNTVFSDSDIPEDSFIQGFEKNTGTETASEGFDITLCTNSMDAVTQVISSIETMRPFAVAFLDVRMPPGPDGIWAAETIRKLDKDIEIVIVTAFSDIHPFDILKRVPPAHKVLYLQKPCYVLEIRHMARSLSAKWAMEKELNEIRNNMGTYTENQKIPFDKAYNSLEKLQMLDVSGVFARTVTEDFNNSLASIIGHVELALMETENNGHIHRRIENIHKACFEARDVVSNILALCRHAESEYQDVVLGDVVKDVAKSIRSSTDHKIIIAYAVSLEKEVISADPLQIRQVVVDLCRNAVEAMSEKGGRLELRTGSPDDFRDLSEIYNEKNMNSHVLLRVSDSGVGMDEQTIEKIFEPCSATLEKNDGNTVPDLSEVHGIVMRQGGFIHVKSKPGKGTVFYVFFKAALKN